MPVWCASDVASDRQDSACVEADDAYLNHTHLIDISRHLKASSHNSLCHAPQVTLSSCMSHMTSMHLTSMHLTHMTSMHLTYTTLKATSHQVIKSESDKVTCTTYQVIFRHQCYNSCKVTPVVKSHPTTAPPVLLLLLLLHCLRLHLLLRLLRSR